MVKVINADVNHTSVVPLAVMKTRAARFTRQLGAQVLAGFQIWNNDRGKNVALTAAAGPTAPRLFKGK